MNHSPSGSLVLGKAIQGFVNYKMAEGLSDRSVDSYERILKKWAFVEGLFISNPITNELDQPNVRLRFVSALDLVKRLTLAENSFADWPGGCLYVPATSWLSGENLRC